MNRTYAQNAKTMQPVKYTRADIPTCFRQKTVRTTLLNYALTAASVIGLLTAILFVIAI